MTDSEFLKSMIKTETMIDMAKNLNEFCKNHITGFWGYFGLVRWCEIQELVNKWIDLIKDEQVKRNEKMKKQTRLHSVK